MRTRRKILKTIACAVAILFTGNTIAMSSSAAVYRINVPEEYGCVKERWKNRASTELQEDKTVIIVQDAHASSEAQYNLANIICSLLSQITQNDNKDVSENYVPFIGIEGAIGEYDLKELREFPIQEAKEIVGKQFVKDGKFIGAELASIISTGDFTLYGLEEKDLFKADYQAFCEISKKYSEFETEITILEEHLNNLKIELFSPELKSFNDCAMSFACGEKTITEYLPYLYEMVELFSFDLFKYCILARFKEVVLQKGSAKAKQDNTADVLSERIAAIDMGALLKDIEQCSDDISRFLAKTAEELKLIELTQRINLIKKVFALQATKEEVQMFRGGNADYSLSSITTEIDDLADGPIVKTVSLQNIEKDVLSRIDNFYTFAEERDQVMVDNLLAKMERENQSVGVLVAGGYHSDGIKKILKSKNINYLSITPNINSIIEDVAYMDRMMGRIAPVDPILTSHLQVSRINASVRALNEVGFEDILKNAGVQIKGQTFFDKNQIDNIIEILKEHDSIIAEAFKQIAEEIYEKNLIDDALNSRKSDDGTVSAVMSELRSRLGTLVEKETRLQKYLEAMETHFSLLMSEDEFIEQKEPVVCGGLKQVD